ncbi:MAG: response regulator [Gramella sp.]|nr:response regulator [Christiangramia sp.]
MKNEKIFLIDDEPIINAIQSLIIQKHFPDSDLIRFQEGKEALKHILSIDHSEVKTLVFLDLNMPVYDAIDFLKELESKNLDAYPDIYVLTYSKNPDEIDFVENHKLVKDVFPKPLDAERINSNIKG